MPKDTTSQKINDEKKCDSNCGMFHAHLLDIVTLKTVFQQRRSTGEPAAYPLRYVRNSA
jgi:hypothetical protein